MKFLILFAVLYLSTILVEGLDEEELVRVVIPPNIQYFDSENEGYTIFPSTQHRIIREKKTCNLPKSLEDSELECNLYPSKIVCNQSCMFGYTFSEGIQREMTCIYEEDKWKPLPGFERCQPFIDCTLNISPGGRYKCITHYMKKGPSCDVSCEKYEDKQKVPTKKHECDIEGKWTPELPFCAKPGTGTKLVSAPRGQKVKSP